MDSIVQRIIVIEQSPGGMTSTRTLYKKKKKRKSSGWAKPMERSQRKSLEAAKVFTSVLLDRHERSAAKKKDGWMKDGGVNHMKAARKAWKAIT